RLLPLAQENDRLNPFIVVVPDAFAVRQRNLVSRRVMTRPAQADLPLPCLVGHDHAGVNHGGVIYLGRAVLIQHGTAIDQVIDAPGRVVDAGHYRLADLANPPGLLAAQITGGFLGIAHAQHLLHGILAKAVEANRADHEVGLPLHQVVAAAVAV